MVAAYCYILSGGRYEYGSEIDFAAQDGYSKGPTLIGEGCWLGAKVMVLDGVSVGNRTVVAAGAVVTKDLPAQAVATGIPARVKSVVLQEDRDINSHLRRKKKVNYLAK